MAFGLSIGGGANYTGMLTRSIVFSGALIAFLVGTVFSVNDKSKADSVQLLA